MRIFAQQEEKLVPWSSYDIHIILLLWFFPLVCPLTFVILLETVASQWAPPIPVNVALWPNLFLTPWKTV